MSIQRAFSVLAVSILPLLGLGAPGCAPSDDPTAQSSDVTELTSYTIHLEAMNETYPSEVPIQNLQDPWTAIVKVGEQTIPAPTHLFGDVVNVIPYSNDDGQTDAGGQVLERGDQIIATYFTPGKVGIALKMHRPTHRVIDLNAADASAMKEDFKLQDTHIGLVVGVEQAEHGHPGAITLNNPQSYEDGRFGSRSYSMIFLEPSVPEYASAWEEAYEDNVRTALVGFNAVTDFPGDYNGGDPLAGNTPEKVQTYVDQMVRAIAGDAEAEAWFEDDANLVYCAELAFLAYSAGYIQPINRTSMVPRVGEEVWSAFEAEVELHNRGVDELKETGSITEPSRFLSLNDNERVGMVRIELAPADLPPMADLAPDPEAARQLLALQPLTMADIVREFMRTHLPRQVLGEEMAPVQGAVLAKMKPGLFEVMGMNEMADEDPRKAAVNGLFDQIVEVVSQPYESYDAFQEALAPYLAQAQQVTGPRPGQEDGTGLFVPPSLFHVAAQGQYQGLIGFQYVGHGVHVSNVQKKAEQDQEPTPVEDISSAVSCGAVPETNATGAVDSCGGQAPGGCFCDAVCEDYGDCCDDAASVCADLF